MKITNKITYGITIKQQTNNKQITTNKNDKNINNDKNIINNISVKHKYGKYQNVLLKDEELEKLKKDYNNWEDLIKYLDEYIEMKGYKAKSHYLAIKKWVVEAVKQNKKTNYNNYEQRNYDNLDNLYANGGK